MIKEASHPVSIVLIFCTITSLTDENARYQFDGLHLAADGIKLLGKC